MSAMQEEISISPPCIWYLVRFKMFGRMEAVNRRDVEAVLRACEPYRNKMDKTSGMMRKMYCRQQKKRCWSLGKFWVSIG